MKLLSQGRNVLLWDHGDLSRSGYSNFAQALKNISVLLINALAPCLQLSREQRDFVCQVCLSLP